MKPFCKENIQSLSEKEEEESYILADCKRRQTEKNEIGTTNDKPDNTSVSSADNMQNDATSSVAQKIKES